MKFHLRNFNRRKIEKSQSLYDINALRKNKKAARINGTAVLTNPIFLDSIS
jgi:hypothetical protein